MNKRQHKKLMRKVVGICSGCGCNIERGHVYGVTYGFCSVHCGMITFGLSYSDFY